MRCATVLIEVESRKSVPEGARLDDRDVDAERRELGREPLRSAASADFEAA